ncbi:MAG: transcriptional regulator, DeoR family, partial [Bacteroidetes bacterium]|nr:transcriptional regulator, DeoR family [Bacteroidota bacterium]
FADRSIQKHYSSALNKVKAGLRSTQKDHADEMTETIKLQLPERLMPDFDYLSLIQNSITSKMIVEIDYKNSKEEVSCRQVEPIGLIFYAFSWHMIAWCHLRADYRDFKVSRLTKLKPLSIPFRKEKHIPLSEFMPQLPVSF